MQNPTTPKTLVVQFALNLKNIQLSSHILVNAIISKCSVLFFECMLCAVRLALGTKGCYTYKKGHTYRLYKIRRKFSWLRQAQILAMLQEQARKQHYIRNPKKQKTEISKVQRCQLLNRYGFRRCNTQQFKRSKPKWGKKFKRPKPKFLKIKGTL